MDLTDKHKQLLDGLGIPRDLSGLSDDDYFRIHDEIENEAMKHKTPDGNSLTDLGELYIDILAYMADL